MKKESVNYIHRGQVEHLTSKGRGSWHEAYSPDGEHGPVYPWMTKREAYRAARIAGHRAVFVKQAAACKEELPTANQLEKIHEN